MIRIFLYVNILNMILGLYYSRYFNYKNKKKIDVILLQETNIKKKTKKYDNYKTSIKLVDTLCMVFAVILGIAFYNLKMVQRTIMEQMELIIWKSILDYILISLWALSLIFAFFLDLRQIKNDNKTYNMRYTRYQFLTQLLELMV